MSDVERMQADMAAYFSAEKHESLLFLVVGVVAVGVAVYLLVTAHAYRGMAYPLIAVGLIQIAVGGAVYFRTDAQVAALQARLAQEPAGVVAEERPRMVRVMKSFALYKVIEIALLAAGIALTFAFRYRREQLYAAGVGLIIQASFMLVADLFAERRGDVYVAAIEALSRATPAAD